MGAIMLLCVLNTYCFMEEFLSCILNALLPEERMMRSLFPFPPLIFSSPPVTTAMGLHHQESTQLLLGWRQKRKSRCISKAGSK